MGGGHRLVFGKLFHDGPDRRGNLHVGSRQRRVFRRDAIRKRVGGWLVHRGPALGHRLPQQHDARRVYHLERGGAALQTPTLTATASGADDGTLPADGALTSIGIHYAYNFAVTGPATGLAVPIDFFVTTTGVSTFSGNAASRFVSVGTAVRVIAPLVGSTFHSVGLASGTAPGVYGSGQYTIVGWGASSPLAINYDSYNASGSYGFTVLSGDPGSGVQTFGISTSVVGGTTGATAAPGVSSTGSVASMIDPYVYIDPAWLKDHPGYSVVVDADVGNGVVSSVPEPPLAWTLLMGLPLATLISRKRRRGLTTNTSASRRR